MTGEGYLSSEQARTVKLPLPIIRTAARRMRIREYASQMMVGPYKLDSHLEAVVSRKDLVALAQQREHADTNWGEPDRTDVQGSAATADNILEQEENEF